MATNQVDRVLNSDSIKMEDVFNDYTLDIAWKQILGLDLKEEEVVEFHKAVQDWISGLLNPLLALPFKVPGVATFTKVGRARNYLVSKVEEKLAFLEKNGPDSSTLSKLYFARDEEDGVTKLTRTQVIHNALLLIFAGTETSASTLTCISLALALHPEAWKKLKDEQTQIVSKYGEKLTQDSLDNSIYLDSIIKETLRIKPVESGELRKVKDTVVVNGQQLPRNWFALFNVKQTHFNDPATYKEDGSHMDIRKGFHPERWMEENGEYPKPEAWMPFGDGKRRCIGERLGMTEMKVFLAILARKVANYDLINPLGPDDKILWKTGTAMARPCDGVEIKACPA
jgi:cytochrome P450